VTSACGKATCILRRERARATGRERIPWALLGHTLAVLLRHRRSLAVAVVSTAATSLLWFVWPYMIQHLTDAAVAGEMQRFLPLIGVSLAAVLLEACATYAKGVSVAALSALSVRDLRNRLTAHIQRLPMMVLASYHSGDLVSRLNNDLEQAAALFRRVPDYVHRPLWLVGGLAFMVWISPKLTLAVCAFMPVSVVIFERFVRPMQKHSGDKMKALAAANASFQDALRGAAIIRAFGLQRILGDRYRDRAKDVERHDLTNQIRNILSFIPFLALRYIPQLIVPIYGGLLAFRGEISVGDLLAVNWLIWTIFEPLEALLAWIREVREAAPALERMADILEAPVERTGGDPVVRTTGDPIVFDGVRFSYGGNGRVLDGTSFRVGFGRSVALVGSSGCGKTTILKMLCGFIEADEGEVRVFGQSLARADLGSLRDHIALLEQDPFLFPGTIAENIAHGHPDATRDEIVAAARAAHADDFISSFEDGYETDVGELGSHLSVGQKQRICLARTILKRAPILLLDEPTAALDSESETVILEALDRLMAERTTVLVSHRISTLRGVDEILLLDGGRIRASGTHGELMAEEPLYRQLAERQVLQEASGGLT
jgi:ABC-type multidrug transport system fused ATPase/permease subunit